MSINIEQSESHDMEIGPPERPALMNALVQTGYGDPHDVLAPAMVEPPEVGPDEVLVRVHAAGVNTPDWVAVTGVPYALRLQFGLRGPATPVRGTDLAGVVVAVGDRVSDLSPGDEVFGSSWTNKLANRAGTFAELTVAPAAQLVPKPPELGFEDAGASVMSGLTALIALRDQGEVGRGTRLLINGASGGVGTFAVQMAKARGAHVTAVCSGANDALVRSLGADEVIDYTNRNFTTEDLRYDVVLDNVLNHRPSAVARTLTDGGILIPNSVGNGGGLLAGLPRMAAAMMLGLGRTDVRFTTCEINRSNLSELSALLESGAVRVVTDSVHRLVDGADGVSRMLTHRAGGNIVIAVDRRTTGERT